MKPTLRWMLAAGVVAIGLATWGASEAKAQGPGHGIGQPGFGQPGFGQGGYGQGGYGSPGAYGGIGGGYGQRSFLNGPVYHPPSVHYDRVYHPTRTHWTPLRGLHTHGHYDTVPHYTPGHFDQGHNGHIDPNPYFHHR